MFTQDPHPKQSRTVTVIANLYPGIPVISAVLVAAGAAAASSAVMATGRITACGQTKEHLLHWIQFSGFHTGTFTAIPRFSYADVPDGVVPST